MHATFVISNPGHHLACIAPVARLLVERGRRVAIASLCELRGYSTPTAELRSARLAPRRVLPLRLRSSPDVAWARALSRRPGLRGWAREVATRAFLGRRLKRTIPASTDVIVIPNDVAFPYDLVVGLARGRGTPFVLVQEGIRFPHPGVAEGDAYGRAGAAAIAVWGESSAEHFRGQGVPPESIAVTGSPRLDDIDPESHRAAGERLLAELEVPPRPLLYLSNPVETQGFCSVERKLDLFRRFLAAAATALSPDRWIVAKLHPAESEADFGRIAAESGLGRVVVTAKAPLYPLLATGGHAVVLASTVGLEAVCFGLPLAVLQMPDHGFVFDYVDSGVASGLRLDRLESDLSAFLCRQGAPEVERRYLDRALAGRSGSSGRIARLIERVAEKEAA